MKGGEMSNSSRLAEAGARQGGPVLPVLAFLSPFATSIAPQLTQGFFVVLAAALIVATLRRGTDWRDLLRPNRTLTVFLVLAAYVLLSTTWAADPAAAFTKGVLLLGVVLITLAAGNALPALDERKLRRAALAFAAGAFAGAVFVIFELLTGGAITRLALNSVSLLHTPKRVAISGGEVTQLKTGAFRNNVAVVLFNLWPALLALKAVAARIRRIAGVALSVMATALAVLLSERLSAQVALLTSILTFPPAMIRRLDFVRVLAILWCLGFALILPASFFAYGLRASSWLPENSDRVRVIYLGHAAERVLEHPWLGIGADSTSALKEPLKATELPEGFAFPRNTGPHPHDFFLQIWYELGMVGAILSALAGVALLLRIPHLPFEAQPFAIASFVTLTTAATFAWSMWQTWLVCVAGLTILYLRVAAASTTRTDSRRAP